MGNSFKSNAGGGGGGGMSIYERAAMNAGPNAAPTEQAP